MNWLSLVLIISISLAICDTAFAIDSSAMDRTIPLDSLEQVDEQYSTGGGFFRWILSTIWKLILVFFFLCLIGLVFFLLNKVITNAKKSINKNTKTLNDLSSSIQSLQAKFAQISQKKGNDPTEIRRIKDEVSHLNQRLHEIEHEFKDLKRLMITPETNPIAGKTEPFDETVSEVSNMSKDLYFNKPNIEGYFEESDDKSSGQNSSKIVYKISPFKDTTKGELQYLSGPRDISNSDFRDTILMPACEIANKEKQHVGGIEMIEPGLVTKSDGKWFVEKKVKIKLK